MIRIFDLPHGEARRLASSGAPIFLHVNPVEYHGPHLSLHNDRLVSQGLSRELHAALALRHPEWPFVVADDLEIGVDPCPGPGSRATPFAVARDLIREACSALADLGASRVVLMTFHGSPLQGIALQAGVDLLHGRNVRALSPFNLLLQEMLTLDPAKYTEAFESVPDPTDRAQVMEDLLFDFHAGFMETSMALHLAPESVDPAHVELPPCPPIVMRGHLEAARRTALRMGRKQLAGELLFAAGGSAWYNLRPFPGYTSRPHLANAASGAVFTRLLIEGYAETTEAVFDGAAPPEPIMSWVAKVTLGGRLGQPDILLGDIGAPAHA